MCLGIIIVKIFLNFFLSFKCVSPQIFSSLLWVLDAHHDLFEFIKFIKLLFKLIISFSDWLNFKFP